MKTAQLRRDVFTDRLLDVAEFTHAHWFFGNLYEALVKVPHRVAASEATRELPRSPLERAARAVTTPLSPPSMRRLPSVHS